MYSTIKFEKPITHKEIIDLLSGNTCIYEEDGIIYNDKGQPSIMLYKTGHKLYIKEGFICDLNGPLYSINDVKLLSNYTPGITARDLDIKYINDIKSFIASYIWLNGNQFEVLVDIFFDRVNVSEHMKGFKTYTRDELFNIWKGVWMELKNNNSEYKDGWKKQNISKLKFIINYDILSNIKEFQNVKGLKEYCVVLKSYKQSLLNGIKAKVKEYKILEYIKTHHTFSQKDLLMDIGISKSTFDKIVKKSGIDYSPIDQNKSRVEVEYKALGFKGIVASIEYLIDRTGFSKPTILKYMNELGLSYSSKKEFNEQIVKYNELQKEIIRLQQEQINFLTERKSLTDDDIYFWENNAPDDIKLQKMLDECNKQVEEQIEKDKNTKKIENIEDFYEEKYNDKYSLINILKKITVEATNQTIKSLEEYNEINNLCKNISNNKKNKWGKIEEDDDTIDFDNQ